MISKGKFKDTAEIRPIIVKQLMAFVINTTNNSIAFSINTAKKCRNWSHSRRLRSKSEEIDRIREDYGQKVWKLTAIAAITVKKMTAIAAIAVKNSSHFCWLLFDQKLTAIEILRWMEAKSNQNVGMTNKLPLDTK